MATPTKTLNSEQPKLSLRCLLWIEDQVNTRLPTGAKALVFHHQQTLGLIIKQSGRTLPQPYIETIINLLPPESRPVFLGYVEDFPRDPQGMVTREFLNSAA